MARHFFALWPAADAVAALARLAGTMAAFAQGRPAAPAKIHLTLAFLGTLDPASAQRAARAAAAVETSPAFRLTLDRVGSFRGARVGWAGCTAPPGELLGLQRRLAAQLCAAGFALEDRPYVPHVTLARGIREPVANRAIEPIAWDAAAFSLVRSEVGRYETLGSWTLPG